MATPMLEQWLALKAEAGSALLFLRMGDFYELFFEDAAVAAAALGIALTQRGEHAGRPVPMCGVPVHAAPAYLARLIRAGHHVAVAEQTEAPAAARRLGRPVGRAIVRVVTPATLTEEELLEPGTANWLAVVAPVAGDRVGLAWADVSTGAFHVRELSLVELDAELARLAPAELVVPAGMVAPPTGAMAFDPAAFAPAAARARLLDHLGVATLDAFGALSVAEVAAAGALVAYLAHAARGRPAGLDALRRDRGDDGAMAIDAATRASLSLARGADGARAGSLLAVVDATLTGPGARLLAGELAAPLTDPVAIDARLATVAWFHDDPRARHDVRAQLKGAPDLERALGRLAAGRGLPRDLGLARDGLARAEAVRTRLADAVVIDCPPLLAATARALAAPPGLVAELAASLVERPGETDFVAPGRDAELDQARADAADGRRLLALLETRLRADTGVAQLKVRHNGVLGYHIEAPARAEAELRHAGFAHRQTLAGVVRFSAEPLAELARRIETAGDRAAAAEAGHLARLTALVLAAASPVRAVAAALAHVDVAAGLAEVAQRARWVRPVVDGSTDFSVEGGRHPVVEAACAAACRPFVANDCDLGGDGRVWLVTGPNMGGKSTFLRQNALIAVLAQAGSFVPARAARIGVVDRLFSRVGASDDLASGRSTFMVEMTETAAILRQATPRSLVILDEVGRGTATYDGLAIAWGVLEHLHDVARPRALFATHYHELTRLAGRLERLRLAHLRAREWRGELVFLHEVAPGAADRSYGLAVARLAGVPGSVVARARTILERLEAGRPALELVGDLPLFAAAAPAAAPAPDPLRAALAGLDLDALSPREAFAELERLQALAGAVASTPALP